jgi:hypothetical protein
VGIESWAGFEVGEGLDMEEGGDGDDLVMPSIPERNSDRTKPGTLHLFLISFAVGALGRTLAKWFAINHFRDTLVESRQPFRTLASEAMFESSIWGPQDSGFKE